MWIQDLFGSEKKFNITNICNGGLVGSYTVWSIRNLFLVRKFEPRVCFRACRRDYFVLKNTNIFY